MFRTLTLLMVSAVWAAFGNSSPGGEERLRVGFAEADITPEWPSKKPIWLAGYKAGRRATGVHDPLLVRAAVLDDGERQVAIASVDLVGLQYETVQRIRARLPNFHYVLVASTHNHEAPDVIGLWGASVYQRGVDDDYLQWVVDRTVEAIEQARKQLASATAEYGSADDAALIGDSRLPEVKDPTLRLLSFRSAGDKNSAKTDATKKLGLIVQWNSHPEALGSRNTLITADFPAATVAKLRKEHDCPVVYLSGALGGLLAPPEGVIKNERGELLETGTYAYSDRYGEAVADLASKAVAAATPITLTPFRAKTAKTLIPVENNLYRMARVVGVLRRQAFAWQGDPGGNAVPIDQVTGEAKMAIQTEVGCLRLGELPVACIPGELYPELVYGGFPRAAEPGVDFPDAPLESTVAEILPGKRFFLIGLANDEIGYLIPRRQWDSVAPFAYGLKTSQYGEINSCGPGVAPVIMSALRRVAQ